MRRRCPKCNTAVLVMCPGCGEQLERVDVTPPTEAKLMSTIEIIINQTAYYNLAGMLHKQKDDLLAKIFDLCQEAHGDKG